jgi:hypothetical protein
MRWQRVNGKHTDQQMKQLSNQLLSLQDKTEAVEVAAFQKLHSELPTLQDEEDPH